MLDLSTTCTQQEFADFVGASQPAVSGLLARGVIKPGNNAAQWSRDYIDHLREQAAGRGGDGELAANRAEESRVRKELLEIKLAERRREVAPVDIIEQVLAHIGSQISGTLASLHVTLKMRCPHLGADDIKIVETVSSEVCNLAVSACMASLTAMDDEGEGA